MGGRFDPVHSAHMQTALEVCQQFEIAYLHFVPTFRPPHRAAAVASFEHRCKMVGCSVDPLLNAGVNVVVDQREKQIKGSSYSYHTVLSFKNEYPKDELFLMMGSDAFLQFDTWYNWQKLLKLCQIVVDQRSGDSLKKIEEKKQSILKQSKYAKIHFCDVTQMDISSSKIRSNLKQGVDATGMLNPTVLDYIKINKLYF
jgi:nicotinate-nucleotide adenylyltransferase